MGRQFNQSAGATGNSLHSSKLMFFIWTLAKTSVPYKKHVNLASWRLKGICFAGDELENPSSSGLMWVSSFSRLHKKDNEGCIIEPLVTPEDFHSDVTISKGSGIQIICCQHFALLHTAQFRRNFKRTEIHLEFLKSILQNFPVLFLLSTKSPPPQITAKTFQKLDVLVWLDSCSMA